MLSLGYQIVIQTFGDDNEVDVKEIRALFEHIDDRGRLNGDSPVGRALQRYGRLDSTLQLGRRRAGHLVNVRYFRPRLIRVRLTESTLHQLPRAKGGFTLFM